MEPLSERVFLENEAEATAFYNHDSNRAVAVMWPAIVENRLTDALRAALRADEQVLVAMFRPDGPLGAFGNKIRLGYLLRLYEADIRDDLVLLSKIRNAFAHRVDIVEFETSPVRDWMDSMNTLRVHRELLETTNLKSDPPMADRTARFVLKNELMDYRDSFHLVIRYLIHSLVAIEHRLKVKPRHDTTPLPSPAPASSDTASEANPSRPTEAPSANQFYLSAMEQFTLAVERAISTSDACAGLPAGERLHWASVLYTKLVTSAVSILSLCPRSRLDPTGAHWSFGSLAALACSIFECSLVFFYIGIEATTEDEWLTRLRIIYLNDCLTRLEMFREFGNNEQVPAHQESAAELRKRIESNSFFMGLPEALRDELLNGKRWTLLSQDEILERMRMVDGHTRGYLCLIQSHAHSQPAGFVRMYDQDTGRGIENEVEKGQMASAMEFCTGILERSTEHMRQAYSGIVIIADKHFDWDRLRGKSVPK